MKIKPGFLITLGIILVASGCGEALRAVSGGIIGGGGGGGDTAMAVPGAVGKTTAELDTSPNNTLTMAGGEAGMRLVQMTKLDVPVAEITTQKTLGLWEDKKYHIEGFSTTYNGGFANAGFDNVSLLYYNRPFEGEFKFSARIRILRAGGVSTSKGIHFGAYAAANRQPEADASGEVYMQFGDGQNTKGMGLFLRTEGTPQFRMYYSDGGNSTTAGSSALPNLSGIKIGKEYIYEISRIKINAAQPFSETNARYEFKLLDSKTYQNVVMQSSGSTLTPVDIRPVELNAGQHPYGTPIEMHEALKGPVYAGVCICGSAAEISQIKVWAPAEDGGYGLAWNYGSPAANPPVPASGSVPLFETPDTIPAYVPAQFIISPGSGNAAITMSPVTDREVENGENVYTWTGGLFNSWEWGGIVNSNYQIRMNFGVDPSFADENIGFEFFEVEAHPAFSIAGIEPLVYDNPAVEGEVYRRCVITIDPYQFIETEVEYTEKEEVIDENTGDPVIDDETGEPVTVTVTKTRMEWRASGRYKVVARDLNLDLDTSAPDYSLLQTLPELYFRINITRPETW